MMRFCERRSRRKLYAEYHTLRAWAGVSTTSSLSSPKLAVSAQTARQGKGCRPPCARHIAAASLAAPTCDARAEAPAPAFAAPFHATAFHADEILAAKAYRALFLEGARAVPRALL